MIPYDWFLAGLFFTLGGLCGLVAFSFVLTVLYLFCAGIISIVQPGPQISEFHLHGDGEDNGAEERNDYGRYPRE